MAIIILEIKCGNCGNDDLNEMDEMFLDQPGLPDDDGWEEMTGTKCKKCGVYVSWRKVKSQ